MSRPAYLPIGDYGLIGNMHTAALVGTNGSIDWLCFPRFDSPSVFAALLDDRKGGRFRISPAGEQAATGRQFYWPDSNVLVTRFVSGESAGEVVDFMPVGLGPKEACYRCLVRRARAVRGSFAFRMECVPAFNYARDPHETRIRDTVVEFRSPSFGLDLHATVPLRPEGVGAAAGFELREGESRSFVLGPAAGAGCSPDPEVESLFGRTVDFWHRWLSRCTYTGRWRETVYRSALALKLLTYEPTGAIVAAPTTSLPEHLGGPRNWDYRYTWVRDAAFTLYALLRIGFTEEAARFMGFLDRRCHEEQWDGSLQPLYAIGGEHDAPEIVLDHLEGYQGSRPVRIGNAAHGHLQLDIYGALLDAVYLYNKYGAPISYDLWTHLTHILEWVAKNWKQDDEGLWEVRGPRQPFVYSKLMCWVALDRGVRLAEKRSFPANRDLWARTRDEIYRTLMAEGWSEEVGAFVQALRGRALDASSLVMPLVFFVSPTDPRMLRTIDTLSRPPAAGGLVSNGLVYRYDTRKTNDGLPGPEGSFNMCSFWLVEALTRAGREDPRRLALARYYFESMLGYANHLGLYAEETGPAGEALGNFPQALTHIALISAAYNLDRTLGSVKHRQEGDPSLG